MPTIIKNMIYMDKGVSICLVLFTVEWVWDEIEHAAHEICNDQSNQNESENMVNVQYEVVSHNG